MDPRNTAEQIGLMSHFSPDSTAREFDSLRREAMRQRDEHIARLLKRAFGGLVAGLGAVGSALLSWPRRRATYSHLHQLSDRELSDIGIARADIARVFEADYVLPNRAANSNRSAPSKAA